MNIHELIKIHFEREPGIITLSFSTHSMLFWETIKSQIDGGRRSFEMARDHLILTKDGSKPRIKIYRVDCANRTIPSNHWKIMDLNDPSFFNKLFNLMKNL